METNKNKLVFATSNINKLNEVKRLLDGFGKIDIISKEEFGINEEIPETGKTIEENAILKARYVFENYNISCFAEDTGLMVEVLNGEPGIYSARYAGVARNDMANMQKLIFNLKSFPNRKAQFKTVIAFINNNGLKIFEGIVKGKISDTPKGESGFGYDPIFIPEGYDKTFAQLGLDIKNKISHRGKAMKKFIEFLKVNYT